MVSKHQTFINANSLHVRAPPQQSVWLERQSSARCGESGRSGIKTPLFEMGALHSLENLFIETEEEGRKNKHTAASIHLSSVCECDASRETKYIHTYIHK